MLYSIQYFKDFEHCDLGTVCFKRSSVAILYYNSRLLMYDWVKRHHSIDLNCCKERRSGDIPKLVFSRTNRFCKWSLLLSYLTTSVFKSVLICFIYENNIQMYYENDCFIRLNYFIIFQPFMFNASNHSLM